MTNLEKKSKINTNSTSLNDSTQSETTETPEVKTEVDKEESFLVTNVNQDNRFQCSAGIVAQNNGNKNPEGIVAMFDLCSSHHFITTSTAKKLSLKKVGIHSGDLHTIENVKLLNNNIYTIKVLDDLGNYRKI